MMKRFFSIILTVLLFIGAMSGCGEKRQYCATPFANDSIEMEESGKDYSDISFKSPEEVKSFLDFKKFEDEHGFIAFNGKGGMIDSEPFTTTDISLKGDKTAEISIDIPKIKISGKFLLKVTDSAITLEDEESNISYKLVD